ncbi:MAG TPA: outer-membrane lipoprotein carrier protein LolA [Xanthobacteraceae bacterium]
MAAMRQAAWIAVLVSGWLAGAAVVAAQTIPLPTPAPAPKDRSAPAPSSTQSAAPAPSAGPSISTFLDSLNALNPFSGKSNRPATDPSTFDAKQRALVNRVSAYLTSVQVLTGNFVQIGPDGRRTTGHLFIQKPGKVRFEYDPPSPIDIIADGTQVVVRDRQLATQDLYPLSQTPLRFLLADRIDLLQDTNVVGVTADDTFVSVLIEEKQAFVGTNRLLMMFDSKDFKLKQWTVTDVQGFDTTIAVSNLDTSKRPDPNLFRFDYTHYVQ